MQTEKALTHSQKVKEQDEGAKERTLHVVYVGDGRQGVH